jgi:hypothetical protein
MAIVLLNMRLDLRKRTTKVLQKFTTFKMHFFCSIMAWNQRFCSQKNKNVFLVIFKVLFFGTIFKTKGKRFIGQIGDIILSAL